MTRKQRFSDEQIKEAVEKSISFRSTLIFLGLCGDGGGNVYALKQRIKELGISTSHFLGHAYLKGKKHNWNKKTPSSEIFIADSKYKGSTDSIKRRYIKEFDVPYECSKCKINEWEGQKLTLQLDHKNGKRNDNRPENLRLLCPNCHSMTQNFAGRNKNRPSSPTAGGN